MASAGIRKTPTGRYKVWWRLDDASQGSQTFDTREQARDFKHDLLAQRGPRTPGSIHAGASRPSAIGPHLTARVADLETINRRLVAERDARAIEADTANRRVAELEDELRAARESLRRVIKSHNRPQ